MINTLKSKFDTIYYNYCKINHFDILHSTTNELASLGLYVSAWVKQASTFQVCTLTSSTSCSDISNNMVIHIISMYKNLNNYLSIYQPLCVLCYRQSTVAAYIYMYHYIAMQ